MGAMAFQITGVSIGCSTVCSGADKKHQSSASFAFVRGIHRWPMDFPNQANKGPVTKEVFPYDDAIMGLSNIYRVNIGQNHMQRV